MAGSNTKGSYDVFRKPTHFYLLSTRLFSSYKQTNKNRNSTRYSELNLPPVEGFKMTDKLRKPEMLTH